MTLANAPHVVQRFVTNQDLRVMRRVTRWRPPHWVRWWMIAASKGGDGWMWYAQGLGLLLVGGSRRWAAIGSTALACGMGILAFQVLKRLIGRQRPSLVARRNWTRLLPPDEFSFPSGHTITAFAFTTSVAHFYPDLLPWLLFCALSVGASRIVLGMHFLSDVLAGCVIGCSIGYFAGLVVL